MDFVCLHLALLKAFKTRKGNVNLLYRHKHRRIQSRLLYLDQWA